MDKILQQRIEALHKVLEAHHITIVKEKAINYGHQITCRAGTDEASLAVYHGKKGFSVVIQGKESPLKEKLAALAHGEAVPSSTAAAPKKNGLHPEGIDCWMGCDESGKGDVFGPLVGAACLITAEEEKKLQRLGVCDSKMLTDSHIAVLAKEIYRLLGDRCITTTLMPHEYNLQYADLKRQQKNLNHLLGSLHGKNICLLLSKHECPCIIVDKFGKDEYVLQELGSISASHQIIQIPKGERDTAVAAASILARYGFLQAMKRLSEKYNMSFPKGAYLGIPQTIQLFCRSYGRESLQEVGKLNFKNFDFLG